MLGEDAVISLPKSFKSPYKSILHSTESSAQLSTTHFPFKEVQAKLSYIFPSSRISHHKVGIHEVSIEYGILNLLQTHLQGYNYKSTGMTTIKKKYMEDSIDNKCHIGID